VTMELLLAMLALAVATPIAAISVRTARAF
jgi:hypothetical protein